MNQENIESVKNSVCISLCQWFPRCGSNACTVCDVLNGLEKAIMNSDRSNEVVV